MTQENQYLKDRIDNYWSPRDLAQRNEIYQKDKQLKELQQNSGSTQGLFDLATDLVLSKDPLIQMIYKRLLVDNDEHYNSLLWHLSSLINPNRTDLVTVDNDGKKKVLEIKISDHPDRYLSYLWLHFDRSETNLVTYFSQQNWNFIYSLLYESNVYEDSGLKSLSKALILSYEQIGTNEALLEELYERSLRISTLFDSKYEELVSPDVKKLLAEDYSEDPIINRLTRYSWVYSFWVRRYHEQNSDAVYLLIQKLDQGMAAYIEANQEEYFEE